MPSATSYDYNNLTWNEFERSLDSVLPRFGILAMWGARSPGIDFTVNKRQSGMTDIEVSQSIDNGDVWPFGNRHVFARWKCLFILRIDFVD